MKINHQNYHTIWLHPDDRRIVQIIDQRYIPFQLSIRDLKTCEDAFWAIREMVVRGAPLIGVTGAYGIYLAAVSFHDQKSFKSDLQKAAEYLKTARPTAVNLANVIDEMMQSLKGINNLEELQKAALAKAEEFKQKEIDYCRKIGEFGARLIREIAEKKKGEPVNILTHCNAGWLACIDWGTATAPIYVAQEMGIPLHVWVDETRPRNQGARLTAFELGQQGIPHTVIPDNTGGHLMQHGKVDLCLVGSDRTTYTGDVANKIGTYLKALAAYDNGVPFYAALPSTTFDWSMTDGVKEIPIEEREAEEVKMMEGVIDGEIKKVLIMPEESPVVNYGFDVTPARLVTGIITERGICQANKESILKLFPERLNTLALK